MAKTTAKKTKKPNVQADTMPKRQRAHVNVTLPPDLWAEVDNYGEHLASKLGVRLKRSKLIEALVRAQLVVIFGPEGA